MRVNSDGAYEGTIQHGLRLAELPEEQGGFAEYFSECEDDGKVIDMRINDDVTRAHTAILMENAKQWLSTLPSMVQTDSRGRRTINETVRSVVLGGWSDYLFPLIRATFPVNVIQELFSVQPTTRRIATVLYWDFIVGKSKGRYTKGQVLYGANTGRQEGGFSFSGEVIDREPIPALGSANATVSGTLEYHDGGGVRPGTVRLVLGVTGESVPIVFTDNGNGEFVATGVTIDASSINYVTGAWSITLDGGATFTTAATNTATYRWASEGSDEIPELDIRVTSATVETERRALKTVYTLESMQDLRQEMGMMVEAELMRASTAEINNEIARQLIFEAWKDTPVHAVFPIQQPDGPGYSQLDHFRDIIYVLNDASNVITARTQKGYGNWLVVDELAASVIESLSDRGFVAAPPPADPAGVHYIGTLFGKFRVYKDVHLKFLPGASEHGNILMGYKGDTFTKAGIVWAPYQLLYTTDTLTRANMVSERGLASRYAVKKVNNEFYIRISLVDALNS